MPTALPEPTPTPDAAPPAVAAEAKSATRAGIFLYGYAPDAKGYKRLHVLAPYTEGRFADGEKCYAVPAGDIDEKDKNSRAAALREAGEESGINFEKLFGKAAYKKFINGEPIENLVSTEYPGLTIIKADPTPIKHTYTAGFGKKHSTEYFAIEVKGIETLNERGTLKNYSGGEHAATGKIKKPAAEIVTEKVKAHELPTFAQLLEIMRSGKIPKKTKGAWGIGKKDTILIDEPGLLVAEEDYHQRNPTAANPITTPEEWLSFLSDKETQWKKFSRDLETLKKYFQKQGLVADSGNKLKFDTKDRPLMFYQEGAEVLPVAEMIARSTAFAAKHERYGRAMWGDYPGKEGEVPPDEATRMAQAQIQPLIEHLAKIAPMEVGLATAGSTELDKVWGDFNGESSDPPVIRANKHEELMRLHSVEPIIRGERYRRVIAQLEARLAGDPALRYTRINTSNETSR